MKRDFSSLIRVSFLILAFASFDTTAAVSQDLQKNLTDSCSAGNLAWVKNLIQMGADPNTSGIYSEYSLPTFTYSVKPISAALRRGHSDVAELLLDQGADAQMRHPVWEESPLSEAIGCIALNCSEDMDKFKKVSRFIITKITDPVILGEAYLRIIDLHKEDLSAFARESITELADLITKNENWSPNVELKFPYEYNILINKASKVGCLTIVDRLVSSGADLNRHDWLGNTPLSSALANGHWAVASRLLTAGASAEGAIAVLGNEGVGTMLARLRRGKLIGEDDDVITAIEKLKDANIPGDLFDLREACSEGRIEDAEALLNGGVFPDPVALSLAIRNNELSIVHCLLKYGADKPPKWRIKYKLQNAVRRGDVPTVETLLDLGADLNYIDNEGSLLVAGARSGNAEMLRLILNRGNCAPEIQSIVCLPILGFAAVLAARYARGAPHFLLPLLIPHPILQYNAMQHVG